MKPLTLLLFFFGVFVPKASAQNNAAPPADSVRLPTIFHYLFQPEVLTVTLEFDFAQLMRGKEGNTLQPAKFRYVDKTGKSQEIAVEVKPKGHSRRKICDIPPIKVKFPPEFLAANNLQPLQTLEMVVFCKNEHGFEQYVLREYAAYRLYSILTENSLRVQLLKIKFKEVGAKQASAEGYAFFVEPEEELAQRLQGKLVESLRISPRGLEARDFDVLSLFEFMIGNTDWYVDNRHNLFTLSIPGDTMLTAVPFDFDYSGFVHTPYALPAERLNIPNVTARYFLGLCRRPDDWIATLLLFKTKKAELLDFCQHFSPFSKDSRKYTIQYLEGFFELLDNPKQVQERIVEHCGTAFIK